jgi:hypothetical protein
MILELLGVITKVNYFRRREVNAEKYIQHLTGLEIFEELNRLHGAFNWIFQQDGAPCHKSQMAVDWIEENCDLLSGWPANSPDLNPIALLWAILKQSIAALEPHNDRRTQRSTIAGVVQDPDSDD